MPTDHFPEAARFTTGSVLQMVSEQATAGSERLQAQGLVTGGQVFIITLDAIAERFGRRWALRQELVWDLAGR